MEFNYIIIFEILVGIFTAVKAKQKNRNVFVWLVLGVLFSLLSLAVIYVIPPKDEDKQLTV